MENVAVKIDLKFYKPAEGMKKKEAERIGKWVEIKKGGGKLLWTKRLKDVYGKKRGKKMERLKFILWAQSRLTRSFWRSKQKDYRKASEVILYDQLPGKQYFAMLPESAEKIDVWENMPGNS